jgi:hypothetical protein
MDLTQTGRYFYHYTTWQTAFERIIPNGTLQLSPYSTMRDPLESHELMLARSVQ